MAAALVAASWPFSGEPLGSCSARHFEVAFDGLSAVVAPLPQGLVCPITADIMHAPVMTCDGQVYERNAIEAWFRARQGTQLISPSTNLPLASASLIPLHALRAAIETYLQHRPEIQRREIDRLSLDKAAEMLQNELRQKQQQLAEVEPVQRLTNAVQLFLDDSEVFHRDSNRLQSELSEAESVAVELAEAINMANQILAEHCRTANRLPRNAGLSCKDRGLPSSSSAQGLVLGAQLVQDAQRQALSLLMEIESAAPAAGATASFAVAPGSATTNDLTSSMQQVSKFRDHCAEAIRAKDIFTAASDMRLLEFLLERVPQDHTTRVQVRTLALQKLCVDAKKALSNPEVLRAADLLFGAYCKQILDPDIGFQSQ